MPMPSSYSEPGLSTAPLLNAGGRRFSLNVDNLLDRKYYQHYYNSYKEFGFAAVGNPYTSAYPGEPRFIELGMVARFE